MLPSGPTAASSGLEGDRVSASRLPVELTCMSVALLGSGTQKLPSVGSRPKPSGDRKPGASLTGMVNSPKVWPCEVHMHDDAGEIVDVTQNVERVVRGERHVEQNEIAKVGTRVTYRGRCPYSCQSRSASSNSTRHQCVAESSRSIR